MKDYRQNNTASGVRMQRIIQSPYKPGIQAFPVHTCPDIKLSMKLRRHTKNNTSGIRLLWLLTCFRAGLQIKIHRLLKSGANRLYRITMKAYYIADALQTANQAAILFTVFDRRSVIFIHHYVHSLISSMTMVGNRMVSGVDGISDDIGDPAVEALAVFSRLSNGSDRKSVV